MMVHEIPMRLRSAGSQSEDMAVTEHDMNSVLSGCAAEGRIDDTLRVLNSIFTRNFRPNLSWALASARTGDHWELYYGLVRAIRRYVNISELIVGLSADDAKKAVRVAFDDIMMPQPTVRFVDFRAHEPFQHYTVTARLVNGTVAFAKLTLGAVPDASGYKS